MLLYNRNKSTLMPAPLRPVAWTPTLLGKAGEFVRSLRYPVADSFRAVRQCKSPLQLSAPGSICRASSHFVSHHRPCSSIGLGLPLGIAVHGAVSANTRTHRLTCVYVPYRQVRIESYLSTTPVDLSLPVVRIDYYFHHVAATYNSMAQNHQDQTAH